LASKGYGESPIVSSSHTTNEDNSWGECKPLPAPYDPVPELPERLIPEPLRAWIVDAAERVSVPLEYIAAPAIVSAGAVIGRSIGIHPKRQDDWIVVPNLWGAIVGPPGMMKTAAISEANRPIRRLIAAAREEFEHDRAGNEAELAVIEMKIAAEKKKGIKAAGKGDDTKLSVIQEDIASLLKKRGEPTATERRYQTQDATVEKIGEILNRNPRGMMLLRDELSGWLRTLDKPGREGDREFFLESAEGTGSFTVDRIGRGTLHIPALTLSIFGGIQPGKLGKYVDGTLAHGSNDDGLLQRFQLLIWPDRQADFKNVDRWPDAEARRRAVHIFERLDSIDPQTFGSAALGGDFEIPAIRFSEGAQELFNEWRSQLERMLRSVMAERSPAFISHLSKYRSLHPALSLVFHLIESLDRNSGGPVSLEATRLAAEWCEYLELHARKLYTTELRSGVQAAHALAARIHGGGIQHQMSIRDVERRGWAGLSRASVVHDGLEVLEQANWVQIERVPTGGRPSGVIYLHPGLRRLADG
jgi:putative DNA primase/helicase